MSDLNREVEMRGAVPYFNGAPVALSGPLASAKILVGSAEGAAAAVTMSGDATLSNAGALTISNDKVAAAELGVTAGTATASKAVVLDSEKHVDEVNTASLKLGASGSTVAVTATATELNTTDLTAQTETIDSGVAVSNTLAHTDIDNTITGAGAITLDVPSAIMKGRIKTITMTVDNGDVTMALTNVNNVAGASAGTTCTFDAIGDCLILAACGAKWIVVGISGAVIS